MKVSEVSIDDGKMCVILTKLLGKVQGLSGDDAPTFVQCKQWVNSLAVQMASELKKSEPPKSNASSDIKIKSIGKISKGKK